MNAYFTFKKAELDGDSEDLIDSLRNKMHAVAVRSRNVFAQKCLCTRV